MAESPIYKQVTYWVQYYGNSGAPDQRAVETFMDCETREVVVMLQNELRGISLGNFRPEILDRLVGAKRRMNHGSYQEWAKLMLLWMSSYKV